MDLFYLFFICALLFAAVESAPQVPYDYIPLGRNGRRDDSIYGHPSDVNHNYERMFPSRRKFIDSYQPNIEKY